jgi:purine-cytosine permease-like protein
MTTPPSCHHRCDYPPPPLFAAPASPFYLPSLIAALVASVARTGSSAPWVSVMVFSANGTVGDGVHASAGLISAAALLVASFARYGHSATSPPWL